MKMIDIVNFCLVEINIDLTLDYEVKEFNFINDFTFLKSNLSSKQLIKKMILIIFINQSININMV
jgi:hypothetical protein